MASPQITVIIPTYNRPLLLPRAVRSALQHAGGDVEVVVVPNGSDQSYRESLAGFASDPRVHVFPIDTPHGNIARNHGMRLARGKYIRFLDDDDYLLAGSAAQIDTLEETGAEICSGLVESVDQDDTDLGFLTAPQSRDFVCAAVGFTAFRLPVGNVFLKTCLDNCSWDIDIHRSQDYTWMITLASQREWKWTHLEEPVGVWYQHSMLRTSSVNPILEREEPIISRLLGLHKHLKRSGRNGPERDAAIAAALWRYAHQGFPYRPFYWRGVARKALLISPGSRPDIPEYQRSILRWLPPVGAECALVPIRRLTRLYRDLWGSSHNRDYRRKL